MINKEQIQQYRNIFKYTNKTQLLNINKLLICKNNDDVVLGLTTALNNICKIMDNQLMIDLRFFNLIANDDTYNIITDKLCHTINELLRLTGGGETCVAHVCLKGVSPKTIIKHSKFIKHICDLFTTVYTDNLKNVYIYNPGFIFEQIFKLCAKMIDATTRNKYIILEKGKDYES
jgi:hypothetical protein